MDGCQEPVCGDAALPSVETPGKLQPWGKASEWVDGSATDGKDMVLGITVQDGRYCVRRLISGHLDHCAQGLLYVMPNVSGGGGGACGQLPSRRAWRRRRSPAGHCPLQARQGSLALTERLVATARAALQGWVSLEVVAVERELVAVAGLEGLQQGAHRCSRAVPAP
jgi:hypothetical protein